MADDEAEINKRKAEPEVGAAFLHFGWAQSPFDGGSRMTDQELWNQFSKENHLEGADYEAWAFGVEADWLAHLVESGIKTATASAYPLYELQNEPLPQVGAYSVILDSQNNAVCIVQTEKVTIAPFCEVTAEHAYKEGEGDRSLDFWRKAHEAFFAECLNEAGLAFTPDLKVVCEEFAVVYRQSSKPSAV